MGHGPRGPNGAVVGGPREAKQAGRKMQKNKVNRLGREGIGPKSSLGH
jgi:hypothetical protein